MRALRSAVGDQTQIMIDVAPRLGWNVAQAQACIDGVTGFRAAAELHSSVGRLTALREPGLGITVDEDRVRAASGASGL